METKLKNMFAPFLYHIFVVSFAFAMVYPVLWMIFGSFKTSTQILNESYKLLPSSFELNNYVSGWRGFGGISFSTFFKNSFFVTTIATLGVTISSAMVAYGFARIRFKGRKVIFACMMATLMLPSQILLIPQYILFQKLKWINTYKPLIVPSFFGSAFFIFMIMQFIQSLPKELDEAAIIDGCTRYGIFTRIVLPLIGPAIITTVIINFYWKWDDFLGPLLYLSRPEKYTVSLAIKAFSDATSTTDYGAMFAMSTLSLLPVFFIFLFFNKYLIEGVSTTGLKG
jgi:multiple sugar transport system permease protein